MRVLIVEDEDVNADRLLRLVREIEGSRLTALRRVATLEDAAEAMQRGAIDVLLLDLNLHGRDGFELLGEACAGSFRTIIVSAHAGEAARAFEYGVTDFVVKPFSRARLERAFQRIVTPDETARLALKFLAVRRSGSLRLVPVTSVVWISGADDYSELHLDDGEVLLHDKTLATLETLLPQRFMRVHRSAIAAIDHVRAVRAGPSGSGELELSTGAVVPVSRRRAAAVREMMTKRA